MRENFLRWLLCIWKIDTIGRDTSSSTTHKCKEGHGERERAAQRKRETDTREKCVGTNCV